MSNNKGNVLVLLLIAALALALGAAGYFYYQSTRISLMPDNFGPGPLLDCGGYISHNCDVKQVEENISKKTTSSVKSYSNGERKFIIEYPSTWQKVEESSNGEQGSVSFSGSEGSTKITWGGGFGGGPCPAEKIQIETKSGLLGMCKTPQTDGSINFLRNTDGTGDSLNDPLEQSLMIVAKVNPPTLSNEKIVLDVLKTFSWNTNE